MGDTGVPECVGLALGGGVMRGLAHVGVLRVLAAEGIPIHVVAGTSAGAITGAFYCAGLDVDQISDLAIRIKWWHIARPVFPWRGLITFKPLERYIIRIIGPLEFSDLRLPFAAVATDLNLGEPYVMKDGPIAPAVRASCSVPGLVVPVDYRGRMLCDGGVSDNIPVAAARALGADFVIGVNLFDPLWGKPRNMFTTGFAAIETLVRRAGGGLNACDILISPDLIGHSYVRTPKKIELLERGMRAAQIKVDAIKAALGMKREE